MNAIIGCFTGFTLYYTHLAAAVAKMKWLSSMLLPLAKFLRRDDACLLGYGACCARIYAGSPDNQSTIVIVC